MKTIAPKLKDTLLHNFLGGIAWGLGITVGIALITYILSLVVKALGGVPLVGDFFAGIVKATIEALNR